MSDIKFRIAAKTDVGCVRKNNEDNFQAAADLTDPVMRWVNNQSYDLGPKGALLVVADGMGGMNAGEVASEIAIDTVREYFAPEMLTDEVTKSRFTIEKFMKQVVEEADRRIKGKSNAQTHGMGTTIVMAWLIDGNCYVCWCGDSRAYIYNPANGLFQVSKDHSYVQNLVDAGEISEEDAFDYPNSNVITRCLCDANQKAVPDCLLLPQPLCDGDIILLCSDGLSGMLRDREMQSIIEANSADMNVLADALIDGALAAGGNDNVTVAVACIDSGGAVATPERVPAKKLPKAAPAAKVATAEAAAAKPVAEAAVTAPAKSGNKTLLWVILGILLAAGIVIAAYFIYTGKEKTDLEEEETDKTEQIDEEDETVAEDGAEEVFEEPIAEGVDAGTPAPRHEAANSGKTQTVEKPAQPAQPQEGEQAKPKGKPTAGTPREITVGGDVQQAEPQVPKLTPTKKPAAPATQPEAPAQEPPKAETPQQPKPETPQQPKPETPKPAQGE